MPVATALPARAEDGPVTGDIVLGADDAPVTVIEYASFTCPHCAYFHQDTYPEFKTNYVDTGKAKFILREVYFDPYGLWASMLARCAGRDGFYSLAGAFMKQQDQWTGSDDIAGALQKIGRVNGLSSAKMRECLTDEGFAEALVADYQRNAEADGITSTPSFVINGELHRGNMDYEEFAALVDQHL